jgi:hypothetical protein
MNIPYFNFRTFKKYEEEVEVAAEVAAKQLHKCNNIGKEIDIGTGRKHQQVIVTDWIFILRLINK